MVQIIASDMDGTLLNDEMVISPGNAAAIKHAQSLGVHFVVSSGRSLEEIKPLIQAADITCPMITLNGAIVLDENAKMISAAPIPDTVAKKIIVSLHKKGLYLEVITDKGVCSDDKAKRIENFAELLASISPDTSYKLAVTLASARMELMNINYVDNYMDLVDDPHTMICKIVVFSQEGMKVLGPIKDELSKDKNLVITSSGSRNIEINHVNAQKGVALAAFADSLNVPMDNVMAIGDNNNDASMIKAAGISYAVGNATDEIKMLAKHLTVNNTEDGVGKAIEEVLATKN